VNGVRLTIQRYSHTPQGAGGSCEWPQRTSINPYSSRPLIPAAGCTPVHPRESGAVRHPPHTCVTAESCAQTCMPHRPDPDVPAMRVSSAATASTLPPARSSTQARTGARRTGAQRSHRHCQQRTRPHALPQRSLAPEVIGWDAPAAVQPLSAPRPPHAPAVPGARRCSRGAPAHGVGAAAAGAP
jgi:hypothetical protein